MRIDIAGDDFVVDAAFLGALLGIASEAVPDLMRTRSITSFCERGVGQHEGSFRLSFFYRNRRLRLSIDGTGKVVRHSVVDFGDHPLPTAMRRPGD